MSDLRSQGPDVGNVSREIANRVKLIHDVEHAAGHVKGQCREILPQLYRAIPAFQHPNNTDVLRANIITLLDRAHAEMLEAFAHLAQCQAYLHYLPIPAHLIEREHSRPLPVPKPAPATRPIHRRLQDMEG